MAVSEFLRQMGERLRAQRKRMGLTQEQAAELLGISTTFYGEVERGNRRLSLEKIVLVQERMNLEPSYLISGKLITEESMAAIFKDCPKEKEAIVEQLLRYITLLYK